MSELGTVEKKSLVARFDEDNIIRIIEDRTDRLIVNTIINGIEQSAPIDMSDGSFSFSFINVTYQNTTASVVTIAGIYTPDDYGIRLNDNLGIAANTTYANNNQLLEYDGDNYFYQVYTTSVHTYTHLENCYVDGNRVIIIDPSLNASCVVKF